MPRPEKESEAPSDALTILVVRSGGIAGMTRRWSVQAPPADAVHWSALVDRCPWDDDLAPGSGASADRYMWRIAVRHGEAEHEREIPEGHLEGAWRDLIEAVRSDGSASA